jgi:hypothetical protein
MQLSKVRDELFDDFKELFFGKDRIKDLKYMNFPYPKYVVERYLLPQFKENNDGKTWVEFFKKVQLLLDRIIFYLIGTKYPNLNENEKKNISFSKNDKKFGDFKEKYNFALTPDLIKIVDDIMSDIIKEVSNTSKYIHRYYPDVEKKADYKIIQADDEGFFTLENGAQISGQQISLKIGNTIYYNMINTGQLVVIKLDDNIDDVDATKLSMKCYDQLEKILDYLMKLS